MPPACTERDLKRLDRQLGDIVIKERCSFGAELRAELAEEHRAIKGAAHRSVGTPGPVGDARRSARAWLLRLAAGALDPGPRALRLAAGLVLVAVVAALAVPTARAAIMGLVGTDPRPTPTTREVAAVVAALPPPSVPAADAAIQPGNALVPPARPPRPDPLDPPLATLVPPATLPELVSRDEARRAVAEEYPMSLQQAGIGGRVGLLLWVRPDGWVEFPRVEHASGVRELDLAALRATRSLRFMPATRLGEEVGTWVAFSIVFEPRRSDSAQPNPRPGAFHIPLSNELEGDGR